MLLNGLWQVLTSCYSPVYVYNLRNNCSQGGQSQVQGLHPTVHAILLPWYIWQHLDGSRWWRVNTHFADGSGIWNISPFSGSRRVVCLRHCSGSSVSVHNLFWTVVAMVTLLTRAVAGWKVGICKHQLILVLLIGSIVKGGRCKDVMQKQYFQGWMWTHSYMIYITYVEMSGITVVILVFSSTSADSWFWELLSTPYKSYV